MLKYQCPNVVLHSIQQYNDIKAIRIFMKCLDFIYCILEKYEDMKKNIINKYISENFYTSKPHRTQLVPQTD